MSKGGKWKALSILIRTLTTLAEIKLFKNVLTVWFIVVAWNDALPSTQFLNHRCFTGGFPFAGIRNKFLLAKASKVTPKNDDLPTGLTLLPLPGNALDMIGVKTSDNVVFLADAVFSAETIAKYHIFYLYDVKAFLETLEKLANLDGALFIPAHCAAINDLKNLIEINRDKVYEISDFIYQCCCSATTEETILQTLFEHYHLTMDATQYVLIGSTVRS